jgi:hypothetical protein
MGKSVACYPEQSPGLLAAGVNWGCQCFGPSLKYMPFKQVVRAYYGMYLRKRIKMLGEPANDR